MTGTMFISDLWLLVLERCSLVFLMAVFLVRSVLVVCRRQFSHIHGGNRCHGPLSCFASRVFSEQSAARGANHALGYRPLEGRAH
jgi:hypothetical protein